VVLKNAGLTTNAEVEALAPDAMRFYAEKAGIGKPSKLVLQKVGPRLEALLENPEGVALPRSIIGEPAAAAEVQPEVLNQIKTQENWDKLPPQVQDALLKNPQAAAAAMKLAQSLLQRP